MADILIRGMEMPKCCALCDLEHWDEDAYGDETNHRCCLHHKGYTAKVRETGRLQDCPLLPLPEGNGDLIDRDNVLLDIDCTGTNRFGMLDEDIRAFLRRYEPIVPAEGGNADA